MITYFSISLMWFIGLIIISVVHGRYLDELIFDILMFLLVFFVMALIWPIVSIVAISAGIGLLIKKNVWGSKCLIFRFIL